MKVFAVRLVDVNWGLRVVVAVTERSTATELFCVVAGGVTIPPDVVVTTSADAADYEFLRLVGEYDGPIHVVDGVATFTVDELPMERMPDEYWREWAAGVVTLAERTMGVPASYARFAP